MSIKDGPIEVAAVDNTWQSDTLIDENLRNELIAWVSVLEDIPESKRDWHPGSNHQVLDLVHPSLFCFIAGRTKVLKQPLCDGVSVPIAGQKALPYVVPRYQTLSIEGDRTCHYL